MAVSTRVRGNGGIFFSLKKGSGSAVVFDDLKSWTLEFEDKDASDVTFSEATAGVAQNAVFNGTAILSYDTGSLYKYLWDNAGAQDILVTVAPKGNASPATDKPHHTFTATISSRPGSGNEANADPNGAGAEFEFTLTGSTTPTWTTA